MGHRAWGENDRDGAVQQGGGLARPEWPQAFNALWAAREQIFGDPEKSPLLALGHVAHNTATRLLKPGEPSRCHRHGGQSSEVHDKGARLPETRGFGPVEAEYPQRRGRRTPRLARGVGHKR